MRKPSPSNDERAFQIESFFHVAPDSSVPWSFPLHTHKHFAELSLVVNGKATVECDGIRYHVGEGDLIIKNAGILHSEISSAEHPLEQYCLGLSGFALPAMPPNVLIPQDASPLLHTGDAYHYLKGMFQYFFELNHTAAPTASEVTYHAIENGISVINMLIRNQPHAKASKSRDTLVNHVLEHINDHFGEDVSLDSLADVFSVSPYYLSHKFGQEAGYTVNQYILNRRLGEAGMRLAFEDSPIKKIAEECGYPNLQYFYAVFKKRMGCTPGEFRSRYKTHRAILTD